MLTFYAHSPSQIARVEMGRRGDFMFTPSARSRPFDGLRASNPAGLPDREIVSRLSAELGYAPHAGVPLEPPPGWTFATPELLQPHGLRRTWPQSWRETKEEYEARTGKAQSTAQVGLLGENNKLLKGRSARPIVAMGLSLAPAETSGHNVCVFSTEDCRRLCLFGTGKGPSPARPHKLKRARELHGDLIRYGGGPEIARIARTIWLYEDPLSFLLQLSEDIVAFQAYGRSHGFTPVVRMNVFSDVRWENVPFPDLKRSAWARNVFEAFPTMQFYDYTKDPGRDLSRLPQNYDLTFSLAETNASQKHAYRMLQRGMNVAVVFDVTAGHPLPATFWGVPVIDGDKNDLRFLDRRPAVVGLRFKNITGVAAAGMLAKEKYGFIQPVMQCGTGLVVAANGKQYEASAKLLRRAS